MAAAKAQPKDQTDKPKAALKKAEPKDEKSEKAEVKRGHLDEHGNVRPDMAGDVYNLDLALRAQAALPGLAHVLGPMAAACGEKVAEHDEGDLAEGSAQGA